MKVFTIGFAQKHAEEFYEKIKKANIDILIDVRLNNTSQLASFSKYPDAYIVVSIPKEPLEGYGYYKFVSAIYEV